MAAKVQGTWRVIDPAYIGIASLTNVDTAAAYPLGTRVKARDVGATAYGDAEFMYTLGGTNVTAASVCTVDGDYSLILVAARACGPVVVAISAIDSLTAKWGWVQISGKAVAKCDTIAANAACYIDGTAGRVDDAAVAGDQIIGMRSNTADDTSTCVVTMAQRCYVADFDNA